MEEARQEGEAAPIDTAASKQRVQGAVKRIERAWAIYGALNP
jgi:hypothetical protein